MFAHRLSTMAFAYIGDSITTTAYNNYNNYKYVLI